MRLAGRVAVVTGAGRGIGRAVALALARGGARVVINDVEQAPAAEVVAEIRHAGGEAVASVESVATMEGARRIVGAAVAAWGRLDILVNNAGIIRDAMMHKMTEAEWDDVIAVCLRGTFACTQAAYRVMREQKSGRIINVTSNAGRRGNAGQANYSAAKAGIIGLTKSNAAEFGRHGITVNAIAPTAVTRMTEGLPAQLRQAAIAQKPLGWEGDPEHDIAPVVAFLCSDEARYMTGQVVGVDGGVYR